MRNVLFTSTLLVVLLLTLARPMVLAQEQGDNAAVRVTIEGVNLAGEYRFSDGWLWGPLTPLWDALSLGYAMDLQGRMTAELEPGRGQLLLSAGSNTVLLGGSPILLTRACTLVGDSLLGPLEEILVILGLECQWNEDRTELEVRRPLLGPASIPVATVSKLQAASQQWAGRLVYLRGNLHWVDVSKPPLFTDGTGGLPVWGPVPAQAKDGDSFWVLALVRPEGELHLELLP